MHLNCVTKPYRTAFTYFSHYCSVIGKHRLVFQLTHFHINVVSWPQDCAISKLTQTKRKSTQYFSWKITQIGCSYIIYINSKIGSTQVCVYLTQTMTYSMQNLFHTDLCICSAHYLVFISFNKIWVSNINTGNPFYQCTYYDII